MMIITTVMVMAMTLNLTLSCGSCEFVANVPALSYLQLGYLGTWAPGYLGTWVPWYLQLCTQRSSFKQTKRCQAEKQLLVF